jgi:hypothetical protein
MQLCTKHLASGLCQAGEFHSYYENIHVLGSSKSLLVPSTAIYFYPFMNRDSGPLMKEDDPPPMGFHIAVGNIIVDHDPSGRDLMSMEVRPTGCE